MTKEELREALSKTYGMENVIDGGIRIMVAPGNWYVPTFTGYGAGKPSCYSLGKIGGIADRQVSVFQRGNDTNMIGRFFTFNFLAEG